jgi:hypothetical protein
MRLSQLRLDRNVIGAESAERRRGWQGRNGLAPQSNGAPPAGGDAPPMGVSFHRAGRRFEGRESAASDPPAL